MRHRLEVGVNKEMQHWRASVVIFMKHYGVKMPAGDPLQTDTQDLNLKPCHVSPETGIKRMFQGSNRKRFKLKKEHSWTWSRLSYHFPFILHQCVKIKIKI